MNTKKPKGQLKEWLRKQITKALTDSIKDIPDITDKAIGEEFLENAYLEIWCEKEPLIACDLDNPDGAKTVSLARAFDYAMDTFDGSGDEDEKKLGMLICACEKAAKKFKARLTHIIAENGKAQKEPRRRRSRAD